MTKNESIAIIKEKLLQVDQLPDAYVENLRKDSRIGVQKLITQLEKKFEKQRQLIEQFQEKTLFEKAAYQKGFEWIAGIDEVGRGPLAGPVVAAAVILPKDCVILGLNDSKQLSESKRNALKQEIEEKALAIGIGQINPSEIDQINIYQASKKAMIQAVEALKVSPDFLLIDAMTLPLALSQEKIIKGDARSISIAAASIIAKVYRDDLMKEYGQQYPGYGFEKNAGYGTKEHLIGLEKQGITPIHRLSFSPVSNYKAK
ncbi:MAG: ribonuclease HII [Enterococcus lemanii]|jgi:ribonuclease HII